MPLAPVIMFVYNRPEMAEQTLRSLQKNELAAQSDLFIYSDGPKDDATAGQIEKIKKVREVIRREKWCGNVNIIERDRNMGLAPSVISGVSDAVNKFGKVIVIEDDVLLSPYFLNYMNDALNAYETNERILSVGSWNYFASGTGFPEDHFLFRYPDSIAWATYKRSWDLFEKDATDIYKKLKTKGLLNKFNGDGNAAYFEDMLNMQIKGNVNSWAIRWTATAILNNKLSVFPKISMSKHIGFGAEATHEKSEVDYNANLKVSDQKLKIESLAEIKEDEKALSSWISFVKANFVSVPAKKISVLDKLKSQVKRLIGRA
jgi:hypothetical protein